MEEFFPDLLLCHEFSSHFNSEFPAKGKGVALEYLSKSIVLNSCEVKREVLGPVVKGIDTGMVIVGMIAMG
jgi:hypothetical protein